MSAFESGSIELLKGSGPSRFEGAFHQSPIGMALAPLDGVGQEVNPALCRLTGYSRNAMEVGTLAEITAAEDLHLDDRLMEELRTGRISSYQVEKRYRHANGHRFWVLVTVSLLRDEGGLPTHAVSQVQDISERKRLSARLEYLVDHDFLTHLFNRRRFEQELTREIQRVRRYALVGALALVDLDNFKDVNDALGHRSGDDLLRSVAGALAHRMRQTDVLARIGGDEFAVLLPQTGSTQALKVAGGIVETVRQQVVSEDDRSLRITASVGVAMFDDFALGELMDHADLAMYEAKQAGKDGFALYRAPGGESGTDSGCR